MLQGTTCSAHGKCLAYEIVQLPPCLDGSFLFPTPQTSLSNEFQPVINKASQSSRQSTASNQPLSIARKPLHEYEVVPGPGEWWEIHAKLMFSFSFYSGTIYWCTTRSQMLTVNIRRGNAKLQPNTLLRLRVSKDLRAIQAAEYTLICETSKS